MKYIYLDTAGKRLILAYFEDFRLIGSVILPSYKDINEKLVENFDFMLNNIGIDIKCVDRFIVNIGPGSFTGVRIGVSFLQGVCLGLGKKVSGISAFDVAALSLNEEKFAIGIKLIGKYYGIKEYDFGESKFGDYLQIMKEDLEKYDNVYILDENINPLIGMQKDCFVEFLTDAIPFYLRKSEAELNFDKRS
ncbi:MAG: tRNA threonylcarbamoyladenosine biosynthesis protein TsaB [Deferribacteres bacterium]|jgi:tRNA threonylcarbamoyl adenosine modification protein YeaZ|nr:tRNA threonylcarbamoyladenosine biosynthesis protein TsaB [Deferribacteres bacterium]